MTRKKYVDENGKEYHRRQWKTSDFFLHVGAKLEFKRRRDIVCYVLDEKKVNIEIEDDSNVWVVRTYSAAMRIADIRARGDKGGKNTPNFQDMWLFEGETLQNRRNRILEEIANDKLSIPG